MQDRASSFLAGLSKVTPSQQRQHLLQKDWAEIDLDVLAMAVSRKANNRLVQNADDAVATQTQSQLQNAGSRLSLGFTQEARQIVLDCAELLALSRAEVQAEMKAQPVPSAPGMENAKVLLPLAKWTAGIRITPDMWFQSISPRLYKPPAARKRKAAELDEGADDGDEGDDDARDGDDDAPTASSVYKQDKWSPLPEIAYFIPGAISETAPLLNARESRERISALQDWQYKTIYYEIAIMEGMPDKISTKNIATLATRLGLDDTITPEKIENARKSAEKGTMRGLKDCKQEVNMVYRVCNHLLRLKSQLQKLKSSVTTSDTPESILASFQPSTLAGSMTFSQSFEVIREAGIADGSAEKRSDGAGAGASSKNNVSAPLASLAQVGGNLASGRGATGAGTGPQLQGADAQQDAEASQDVEVLPPHAAGPMRELLDSITTEDLDTVERDVYATMLLFTDYLTQYGKKSTAEYCKKLGIPQTETFKNMIADQSVDMSDVSAESVARQMQLTAELRASVAKFQQSLKDLAVGKTPTIANNRTGTGDRTVQVHSTSKGVTLLRVWETRLEPPTKTMVVAKVKTRAQVENLAAKAKVAKAKVAKAKVTEKAKVAKGKERETSTAGRDAGGKPWTVQVAVDTYGPEHCPGSPEMQNAKTAKNGRSGQNGHEGPWLWTYKTSKWVHDQQRRSLQRAADNNGAGLGGGRPDRLHEATQGRLQEGPARGGRCSPRLGRADQELGLRSGAQHQGSQDLDRKRHRDRLRSPTAHGATGRPTRLPPEHTAGGVGERARDAQAYEEGATAYDKSQGRDGDDRQGQGRTTHPGGMRVRQRTVLGGLVRQRFGVWPVGKTRRRLPGSGPGSTAATPAPDARGKVGGTGDDPAGRAGTGVHGSALRGGVPEPTDGSPGNTLGRARARAMVAGLQHTEAGQSKDGHQVHPRPKDIRGEPEHDMQQAPPRWADGNAGELNTDHLRRAIGPLQMFLPIQSGGAASPSARTRVHAQRQGEAAKAAIHAQRGTVNGNETGTREVHDEPTRALPGTGESTHQNPDQSRRRPAARRRLEQHADQHLAGSESYDKMQNKNLPKEVRPDTHPAVCVAWQKMVPEMRHPVRTGQQAAKYSEQVQGTLGNFGIRPVDSEPTKIQKMPQKDADDRADGVSDQHGVIISGLRDRGQKYECGHSGAETSLPESKTKTQAGDSRQGATNSPTGKCSSQLQAVATATGAVEWAQLPACKSAEGSDRDRGGFVEPPAGSDCTERRAGEPSDRLEQATDGRRATSTHHPDGDESSGRRSYRSDRAAGVQELHDIYSSRCNNIKEVPSGVRGPKAVVLYRSTPTGKAMQTAEYPTGGGTYPGRAERALRQSEQEVPRHGGILAGEQYLPRSDSGVGHARQRPFCGPMECKGKEILHLGSDGPNGDHDRCAGIELDAVGRGKAVCVSAAGKEGDFAGYQAGTQQVGRTDNSNSTAMADAAMESTVQQAGELAGSLEGRAGYAESAAILQICRNLEGKQVVESGNMEFLDWDTFVCRHRQRRAGPHCKNVTRRPRDAYKPRADGPSGKHLDARWRRVYEALSLRFGKASMDLSDIIVCDVVAEICHSESDATHLLSAARVVLEMSFGTWSRDARAGKLSHARGKEKKPSASEERPALDMAPLWTYVQDTGKNAGDPFLYAGTTLKNNIILCVCAVLGTRADDLFKTSLADRDYCEFYGANGLVVLIADAEADAKIVRGKVRFKDNKDKKSGEWSKWVHFWRMRPKMLVDAEVPHLQNEDCIKKLDWIYLLNVYWRRFPEVARSVEPGKTFCDMTAKKLAGYGTSRTIAAIQPSGIGKMIRNVLDSAKVDLTNEVGKVDVRDAGGHIMRSFSSSSIYHARQMGVVLYAQDEHVLRTRHTSKTFETVYLRALHPRQEAQLRKFRNVNGASFDLSADEVPFA